VTLESKKLFLSHIAIAILAVGGIFSFEIFNNTKAWGNDQERTEKRYREALEALYHATGGDDWHRNDGWLTDAPLEDWYGLRMSDGRITHLELDDNNLIGELPREVKKLDLYSLDFRWNSISGGLAHLKKMKTLGELLVSANNFGGRIPSSLGNITSLRRLDLSNNRFTGKIPNRLTRLKNLASFAAHSNNLTGELPRKLCDLPELQRLVLSDNELSGSIADTLAKCAKLHLLNLANNQFEGNVPAELTSSENLKWLDLRGNEIDEEQQIVFQMNYVGIPNQLNRIGEPNGLTMWSRDSRIFLSEEHQLVVVQSLNAISIKDGLIEVSEATVPSSTLDQTIDLKEFVNSHLLSSDTRINTIVDFERMMAKAAKHFLTKTLEGMDSNVISLPDFYFELGPLRP